MGIKYIVKGIAGTYKDKEGNEKTKYVDMGAIMEGRQGGYVLKLNAIPVNWDGWAYLNEPENYKKGNGQRQQGQQTQQRQPQRQNDGFEDKDIPF
jgi:hypothetical protein